MSNFLSSRLSPFRHQSFRRFFLAQNLSLIGSWSHELARAWLVIEIMGSAGALGILLMATAIPSLFFILHGGVIVDRIDARKLMMLTKTLLAFSAIALAYILEFQQLQFWQLIVFGIIEGCVVAFDAPAFQTLVVRMVPKEDFQQTLAINSTNFHFARTAGPLVAGLLMAFHGPSAVFLFDAVSYLGVILVLSKLDLKQSKRNLSEMPKARIKALVQGFQYLWKTPTIRFKILQLFLTISIIFPIVVVVFRTFIQKKFGLSSEQFGYMFLFPAMGSMLGAVIFAIIKPNRPSKALWFGIPGTCIFQVAVAMAPTPYLAAIFLAIAGFCLYLTFVSLTISLHLEVKEEYRGRLSSVIGLGFLSIGPLMGLPIGVYADNVGFEMTIFTLIPVFFTLSALLALFYKRCKRNMKDLPSQKTPDQIGFQHVATTPQGALKKLIRSDYEDKHEQ